MNYRILPYNQSLTLLTDLYEITMAYGYWKSGTAEREAVFHHFFRKNPFQGGYTVACGLDPLIDYIENVRFDDTDLHYLASLKGNDDATLLPDEFLEYLRRVEFSVDVDAVPEGTVIFPQEPLVRVQGPILQCQLLESAILNILNFQTLIASKAARLCWAAGEDAVVEFGLRRAQGIDGSISASRAAYVGGCAGTSNVLAGKLYGIPVKGTHAHSWVMSFDTEAESFDQYARAMPNNCIFLVDTYDTIEGVRNAIEAGKRLREAGHQMIGIRLDSGDLAYLSITARKMLDDAGFQDSVIVASNDLDEHLIQSLKDQGAQIHVWGVGTRLATGFDDPALGGVYKLTAIRNAGNEWDYKIKLSEQAAKVTNPGILQVRRYYAGRESEADVIYDIHTDLSRGCVIVDPMDLTRQKEIGPGTSYEDLLVPVFRKGKRVYTSPDLGTIRKRSSEGLAKFHSGVKRFLNPHRYPVGLERGLHRMKTRLTLEMRHRMQERG